MSDSSRDVQDILERKDKKGGWCRFSQPPPSNPQPFFLDLISGLALLDFLSGQLIFRSYLPVLSLL